MENKHQPFPHLPKQLRGLAELAENLWWSWHPEARMLFKTLSRRAWKESNHNPDKMLRELPPEAFAAAVADANYMRHYEVVLSKFRTEIEDQECDLLRQPVPPALPPIAYFSAEYGLHHSLPFYAGGLGFLAGDHLKECSDLKIPLVAVGFMYPKGYVHQQMREDGWQENFDQNLDREVASISRVTDQNEQQLTVRVPLIDPPVHVAVWRVKIGHIPLYLLDTDIESNDPGSRSISARLYTGDIELRLRQEIVLGIGGSEVLESLGIKHSILHLNEGHAAFSLLERIRDRVQQGISYDEAAQQVKRTSIFTTHTPVAAGHDIFPAHLIEKYFHAYWPSLGLDRDRFFRLGNHPQDPHSGFNMTAFAMQMCEYRNAVSQRHGEVTRRLWQSLWSDLPEDKIPITHVTNGVHLPTWIEPKLVLLFNKHLGYDWLSRHDNPAIWELIETIPDKELWQTHYWLKIKLIDAVRQRTRQRWTQDHVSPSWTVAGGTFLDPSVLTIGFARRFATYKRAALIFHDIERLKRILNDRWRPIQIIFAGKAHPADDPGKQILQKIFNLARDPALGGRIAFVENYGEQLAQYMVHGVDIWLNNPSPPMEASGTSGMKAALNGVPHLSIRDGWWIEGYNGKNGWTFGNSEIEGERDGRDAAAIYQILEEDIIPLYYKTNEEGVPHYWVKIMKASIISTAPRFSARRMVREYVQKFYARALKEA